MYAVVISTYVRGVTIHNLGVSIYCHFYSDILYDTVKCELADFYGWAELFSKITTFHKH